MSPARSLAEVFEPTGGGVERAPALVALMLAVLLSVVAADLALTGGLSLFFDLCFVVACLALAMMVHSDDTYTAAVLPPVLFTAVFVLVAVAAPGVLGRPDDELLQRVVSGLAHHSVPLTIGYALALGWLALRRRSQPTD